MRTHARLFVCLAFLVYGLPAQAGLSEEGKQAASALARAGWSGHVKTQDLDLTVRRVAVCTPAMRNALAHLEDLPVEQQKAFADWGKIEFLRAGWFFKSAVEKGTYGIGLGFAHGQPMFTFRKGSRKIAETPFWFEGDVQTVVETEARQVAGASVLTIRFGNIRLPYRFIPKATYETLLKPLRVYGKGRVKIRSDLNCHEQLHDLASWLEKAMEGSESFFGGSASKDGYELCLFATPCGYQGVDQLLTRGAFSRNKAFTSDQTKVSYVWYHPHAEPEAFADHGIPLRLKVLCLHELQHALSYKNRPSLGEAIPRWFAEALAERGVHAGLAVVDKKLAKDMHQRHVDRLVFARADTSLPTYQDLMVWEAGKQLSELYSAAYLFSYQGLSKKSKDLPELLTRIVDAGFTHESLYVLRDAGWDAAAYAKVLPSGRPKLPMRVYGDYDQIGKSLRLISSQEGQARILLPQAAGKDKLQLAGSFSWFPMGARQVDLYLGYRRGIYSAEFLKLALMPGRVVLFSFRSGTWFRIAIKDYDEKLEVGTAKERAWHRFSIELDAKAGKLEIGIDKDRKASFTLPGSVDLAGSRVGLGVYDGIAWFKDITIR